MLLIVLSGAISSCTPTLHFEVQGPAMSGVTTVNACPSPQASPGVGVTPSAKIGPAS